MRGVQPLFTRHYVELFDSDELPVEGLDGDEKLPFAYVSPIWALTPSGIATAIAPSGGDQMLSSPSHMMTFVTSSFSTIA